MKVTSSYFDTKGISVALLFSSSYPQNYTKLLVLNLNKNHI